MMDISKTIRSLEGSLEGFPDYIEHKMIVSEKNSETKYGQITFSKENCQKAGVLFKDYFNTNFELVTFKGNFKDKHFLDERLKYNLVRLSCKPFFSKLEPGTVIYFQKAGPNKIRVTKEEPIRKVLEGAIRILKVLEEFKKKL